MKIYKIMSGPDWDNAAAAGVYHGSADDKRDGYIHLSAAEQLEGTAKKYFAHQSNLVLIAFNAGDFGDDLKWEASRGGALFPHLYAPLDPGLARDVMPLVLDAAGLPILPALDAP